MEDDYYDEYDWDDEFDVDDDFGGIYDDGVGLFSCMSDFDGDDEVVVVFLGGFFEEEVISIFVDCFSWLFKYCCINNRKGGGKLI